MPEKFIENLDKASSILKTADHMLYMTYPLVKEKRLLLKILNETYFATLKIINAILQYEYLNKRIQLFKDAKTNFTVFKQRCSQRYNISEEQIKTIEEIFNLTEKHKNSPFEFVRQDKIVIMSNALHTDTITIDKIKSYILISKDLLRKADTIIRERK